MWIERGKIKKTQRKVKARENARSTDSANSRRVQCVPDHGLKFHRPKTMEPQPGHIICSPSERMGVMRECVRNDTVRFFKIYLLF